MARQSNYVPSNAMQFGAFLRNVLDYVNQKKTAWGHIPAGPISALTTLHDAFADLLEETSGQRTPAQTHARNAAQAEATRALRAFVNQYLRFAPVNDTDRVAMGIPNRDTIPTTIPPPAIPVIARLTYPSNGLVEVCDIKPDGVKSDERSKHGVRIYYGIVSETSKYRIPVRPKSGEDLPHSVFTRRNRYRFDFSTDNGKEAFFCMRFENSKGDAGPWGKIISGFIP